MADTTEVNLQIVNQETGGNDGTWGDIADANFQKLVDAITEQGTIAVTGGTDSLTDDQQRDAVLNFTGTLTSNEIVKVNDTSKKLWFARNNTTGSYTLTVQTDTGTGIAVTQGRVAILYADGTNVIELSTDLIRTDLYNHNYIGTFTENGDANTLTCTSTDIAVTAYTEGMVVIGKVTNANTSAMTCNVNAIGVKNIEDGLGAAIQAGVVPAGSIIVLHYNNTNDSLQLMNIADPLRQNTAPKLYGPLNPNGNYVGVSNGTPIASAATLVIGTDGDYMDVTGTMTVTAMTVATDRLFVLQTNGSLTLTHGATLQLPGNASIVTQAGDHYLFYAIAANSVVLIGRLKEDLQINEAKGANVASAAALAPGRDGNFFDVTGVTTITSINSLGVGTEITLHFTGILTLTHNATTLILPTGANIATEVGDVVKFVEESSGNWRCVNYMRGDGEALSISGSALAEVKASSAVETLITESISQQDIFSYTIAGGEMAVDDVWRFTIRGLHDANENVSPIWRIKGNTSVFYQDTSAAIPNATENPWSLIFDVFRKDGAESDIWINGVMIYKNSANDPNAGEGALPNSEKAVPIRGNVTESSASDIIIKVTLNINDADPSTNFYVDCYTVERLAA